VPFQPAAAHLRSLYVSEIIMEGYEKRKIAIELLKHITILSVGTLAIFVSFLNQIKTLTNSYLFVSIIVIAFAASILSSLVCSIIVLGDIQKPPKDYSEIKRFIYQITFLSALLGFFIGVFSIVVFILTNLSC